VIAVCARAAVTAAGKGAARAGAAGGWPAANEKVGGAVAEAEDTAPIDVAETAIGAGAASFRTVIGTSGRGASEATIFSTSDFRLPRAASSTSR